jgi:Holliday junction resolvasome RuvABC endonuclease subunit
MRGENPMPKTILAFDLGSNAAGCVALVEDTVGLCTSWAWVRPANATLEERERALCRWIRDTIWQSAVEFGGFHETLIAVEAVHLIPDHPRAVAVLSECIGLLVALAPDLVPIVRVQPSKGKKALTGNGRADKEAMLDAAKAQFPDREWWNEHEADALGVALAARAQLKEKELANAP